MRHDLSHLEPDLHPHFRKGEPALESMHVRAERIRRHYLWAMIVSIGLFLAGLAVLVFAVPAYVQFITTPNP